MPRGWAGSIGLIPMTWWSRDRQQDCDKSHPLYDVSWRHEIDEALVQSIMAAGVHTTVKVRKDGESPEVVDGRRRILHAREANKRLKKLGREPITVPCQVFKLASDKDATLLMMSSNAHGLSDDPIDRAEKAAKALASALREKRRSPRLSASPRRRCRDVLKLIDCSDRVKSAVRQGRMTASAAVKMTDLTRAEQDSVLDELLQGEKKPTVRETGQIAAEKRAEKAAEKSGAKPVREHQMAAGAAVDRRQMLMLPSIRATFPGARAQTSLRGEKVCARRSR